MSMIAAEFSREDDFIHMTGIEYSFESLES